MSINISNIVFINPTTIKLVGLDDRYDELCKLFTYTDKSIQFQIQRFKKARWFVNKYGEEAFQERIQELKDQEKICLLNEKMELLSGLYEDIALKLNLMAVERHYEFPEFRPMAWHNKPKYELRYYQKEAVEKLLHFKHGAVSLPTGSGKTAVIRQLIKQIGLKTVIICPSISIARQMYEDFIHHFGTKNVGLFGDGKKEFKKKVVIAISKSLDNVEKGTEEFQELSKAEVFIADESHLCPADTLKKVCLNVLGASPYRFFLSATQMRNDGSDMLLKGIIGPIVYSKESKELIEQGFLAKPTFFIKSIQSPSSYVSNDPLKMMSHHLYHNKPLHKDAAELANKLVSITKHQVLLMIDHIDQFQYLHGHLLHKFAFAHGGVTKTNRHLIPEIYWKSDPQKLVKEFNDGKLPILIGTSCISIGTDIKPVNSLINLQGGKSEIKFCQLLGRGTRITENKKEFNYFDYSIIGPFMIENHTATRIKVYKDFYDNIKFI